MRDSRLGTVLVLIAAELLILGIMARSVGATSVGASAAGIHRLAFQPRVVAPIDAGASPHVVVSDSDSKVVVKASTDGLVHVSDLTSVGGAVWGTGNVFPVDVTKTADGVKIERPQSQGVHDVFSLGWFNQRIEVAVPPQSTLEIQSSSGSDISDLQGPVTVHSVDGRITATHLRGTLDAKSDDGSITLQDVVADSVKAFTNDGRLRLFSVDTNSLDARTLDGSIRSSGLHVGSGKIQTSDGSIVLGLRDPNYTLAARTGDGHIRLDGTSQPQDDNDSSTGTFRLGSATGSLDVSTTDGSITITTNGTTHAQF